MDDPARDESAIIGVLPMFPLGSVLFPGGVLPLHVFEPRYAALVQQCIAADDHEFGVVLIDRGHEVGGGDVRRRVGTVARVVQVAEIESERYAVVSVGTRRIQVAEWLEDAPYPRAEVLDWPDDPDEVFDGRRLNMSDLYEQVRMHLRRTNGLAVELGDLVGGPPPEWSDDPFVGSYQLSNLAPVGSADEYDLLCAPGPVARLLLLDRLLDDIDIIHRFRLGGPGEEPPPVT